MTHSTHPMQRGVTTTLLCALALLAACGGGDDGVRPAATAVDVTTQVSPQASTDAQAATSYVDALSSTPAEKADTLEPVAVPAALATDDTAEPT